MTAHIVLIHGGESTGKKFQAIMPDAVVTVVYKPGLSSVYDELTGLAKDFPTIASLMAQYAPSWSPGDPLVVMGFSAGGWALRHYLRSAEDRSLIAAAVFLDSLYASGGACVPFDGVLEFAKMAVADSSSKRLVMTYSQGHPGPGICSNFIAKEVGQSDGPAVYVVAPPGLTHGDHQGVVGPLVLEKYIAGWLPEGKRGLIARTPTWLLGALAVAAGAGAVWLYRKRRGK